MSQLSGRVLMVTAMVHTAVGVVLFRDPLAAILGDGFFNAIRPHFDRAAAFWFLLFSPVLFLLGQITNYAVGHRDAHLVRLVGCYLLGMGILGVAVLPISGFWILIALTPLLLTVAYRVEAQ
jgi:hypothetical protein